jgi:hypothetical protein
MYNFGARATFHRQLGSSPEMYANTDLEMYARRKKKPKFYGISLHGTSEGIAIASMLFFYLRPTESSIILLSREFQVPFPSPKHDQYFSQFCSRFSPVSVLVIAPIDSTSRTYVPFPNRYQE